MDVRATVEQLAGAGVRVHCLALGGVDLTSAAGRMTMQVISAVAEFERDLLIERTQSGLRRAKAEGKAVGRSAALSAQQRQAVLGRLEEGASVAASCQGILDEPSNNNARERRPRWTLKSVDFDRARGVQAAVALEDDAVARAIWTVRPIGAFSTVEIKAFDPRSVHICELSVPAKNLVAGCARVYAAERNDCFLKFAG